MYTLHGTWIPEDTDQFMQTGAFSLWVETVSTQKVPPGYHVKYLSSNQLETLLISDLGVTDTWNHSVRHRIGTCYVLLPSINGQPLPSPEPTRRLAITLPQDAEVTLSTQTVSAYRLPDVLKNLDDLYFLASYVRDELVLGKDLRFWMHYSQTLKRVLQRDQYIPALKYQSVPKKPRSRRAATCAIHPGWEIISQDYETQLEHALEQMPPACVSAAETAHEQFYDKEGLLRHFSECVLTDLLLQISIPASFQRKISDSLLDDCLHPDKVTPSGSSAALQRYQQWQGWRQALTMTHGQGFQLCLQLLEGASQHALWTIRFLAVSQQDLSLKLDLGDYWLMDARTKKNLQASFGPDFEQHLMQQLGYAARMYPKLWQGLETNQPVGLTLPLEEAFAFLQEHAWVLEDAGFKVIVPAWWTAEGRRRARLRIKASGRKVASGPAAAGSGYFSLDAVVKYRFELAIGDQTVTEQEWRQLVNAKSPLVQFRGQWVELEPDKMEQLLEFWQTHGQDDAEMPLGELLRKAAAAEDDVDVSHDSVLADMLAKLHDPSRFQPIADPPGINGVLRDYQKRGVAWIQYLEELGLNGCLADDMGLGKTLQVITRLVTAPAQGPTLLIAPTTVLGNWQKEIETFAPQLKTILHHGSDRAQKVKSFQALSQTQDMVITSFNLARRDAKLLQSVDWERVVIDEAQNIKNPKTAQTKAILKLKARHRLALTGTPVENRLLDLWSLFHFLNPGYLDTQARFRRQFELPIQRNNDLTQSALLKKLVQPFILRRVKTDKAIIKDLPDKVEHKLYCNLTKEQASLYQAVVEDVEAVIHSAEGIQRKGLILATLMKLKQICNHPRQFLQDGSAFTPERSHKLKRLIEMLEEVIAADESLLIFTQFTEIGAALERHLRASYLTYYLHGGISRHRREQMISAFQNPDSEPAVFILSLKAGGVGINLTRANHVFHFDRWWNPAVEDQATDRAFRIGQTRNVFVHKFVTLGTLEERIDRMIEDKKQVAGAIIGADESWLTELDNDSFKRLIALQRTAVME